MKTPGPVRTWVALAGQLAVGAIWLSLLATALHDVSQAWDVCYYHLPFAARLWGLVPADEYVFSAANQVRFEGFPLLGEILQGLCWRLTSMPESTNLVALLALAAFVAYLRWRFRVAWPLATIALLAVPLVELHATSSYLDLPANLGVAVLLLEVVHLYSGVRPLTAPDLLVGVAGGLVAVHMRLQLLPITTLGLGALLLRARHLGSRWTTALLLLLPLVYAWPLKNALVHGNPVYPVRLDWAWFHFPGPDEAYSASPANLADAPRAFRWLYSILEIGQGLVTEGRWSVDQWAPLDSPRYRTGGFSGPYVVAELLLLAASFARNSSRTKRVAALVFALATLVAAHSPQSHELRYYLYWMLLLVALNLVLWTQQARSTIPALVGLGGFALVVVVTRASYLYPTGTRFDALVKARTSAWSMAEVSPGERVCLGRPPWTFLYTARFHANKRYVLKEREEASDCAGFREIP